MIQNRLGRARWWRAPLFMLAWALLAAPVVAAAGACAVLRSWAADLPEVPDLDAWEREAPATSEIVAADGTVLAEIPFRTPDGQSGHRWQVGFDEIPSLMVQAVLAAEDQRFFEHAGVDMVAVVRAAWANYRAGEIVEGASTLTQQVARNLLPEEIGSERSLRRKGREALLARRIELRYDKQRIFEVYVNHAFLGAGAYGIAAAARAYFDRPLSELSLAQLALIAGLAQAPGRADPYRNPEAALARRNQVLDRMLRAGAIDVAARDRAVAAPLALEPPPQRYGSLAPWHTERARQTVQERWPEEFGRGGLRIETSAAVTLALTGEVAIREHVERLARRQHIPPPEVGALVWDHRTGYVEATFGGVSWAASKFDRSTQACRQPGSAFKPVVYASALEQGAITPGTPLRDAPIAEWDEELGVHWKPTNSGRAFRGVALAEDALAASLNAPAVAVLDRVGAGRVIELAHRLGITSPLVAVRPLALGASCVIPIELAGAFAAIAERGMPVEPVFVVRVTRGDELLLDRASPLDPTLAPGRRLDRMAVTAGKLPAPVLDEETAYQVSSMLAAVVSRGTGHDARAVERPAAGKTGTTNGNTDAWFVGYTGRAVAAVWLGHDDPTANLGARATGGRVALPLWVELMRAAEADRPVAPVPGPPPPDLTMVRIDRDTGLRAAPGAGGALELYFKSGTEPTQYAGRSSGAAVDLGRVGEEF